MYEDTDFNVLDKVKSHQKKKSRSFKSEINRKILSDEELDDLFLDE
ncbi:hypothetical protein GF327_09335 [Candidatus Woesearchaeota archaeon]|nr:hypothetical protein [Candidatus Woesearchaeota archaeon]